MYAIIQTGGKQYKVQPGDQLKVEKLEGMPGDEIKFAEVLAIQDDSGLKIGVPVIESATVNATILRTAKDRKIIVFKKKRRHGFHKKQGHRQWFTLLKIDGIES